MYAITNAQSELNAIKERVIGIFKISNRFELVVEVQIDSLHIDTIHITNFGAIHENFNVPVEYGILKLFPDNKNMNEMLLNPFEWQEFIKPLF